MKNKPLSPTQFIVDSSVLRKALAYVGPAVKEKPIIPILDNLRLTITAQRMDILATDLSTNLSTTIDVIAGGDLVLCVPYKKLAQLLSTMPEQPLTFTASPGVPVLLSSASGNFKLPTEDAATFPKAPVSKSPPLNITLPANDRAYFIDKLDRIGFCVAEPGKSKEHMEGVCWWGDQLASTDGYQMALATEMPNLDAIENNPDSHGHLIPTTAAALLVKCSKNVDASLDLTISLCKDRISAQIGENHAMSCRMQDYQFPAYHGVFAHTYGIEWLVDRLALLAAIKRVMVLGTLDDLVVVRGNRSASAGWIEVIAGDIALNQQAVERVDAEVSQGLTIGLNGAKLGEALTKIAGDTIVLNLRDPMWGVQIIGADNLSVITFPVNYKKSEYELESQPETVDAA